VTASCLCQGRLQPVRWTASILHAVALAPLPSRLLRDPVAIRHDPRRLVARLDSSPDFWRRRRLLVKLDERPCTPFLTALRTDFAMKKADRRELM
jgi:hypothetical protein